MYRYEYDCTCKWCNVICTSSFCVFCLHNHKFVSFSHVQYWSVMVDCALDQWVFLCNIRWTHFCNRFLHVVHECSWLKTYFFTYKASGYMYHYSEEWDIGAVLFWERRLKYQKLSMWYSITATFFEHGVGDIFHILSVSLFLEREREY
jgi:hypothetical protein